MKEKWIKKDGNQYEKIVAAPVDKEGQQLKNFLDNPDPDAHDKKQIDNFKKRKQLNVKSNKSYKVTKGPNFAVEKMDLETELTTDMLRTGDWKNKQFKKYNFDAETPMGQGGHCHPLMQVRE